MKLIAFTAAAFLAAALSASPPRQMAESAIASFPVGQSVVTDDVLIQNHAIDIDGFLRVAHDAAVHRESRRLSEAEFLRMSQEPGTIVLDARSREKFDLLHIEGAVNLSFPDMTIESLAWLIPDKSTRILIYCNNNFRNAERAFPSKLASASLNLSTYTTLFNYGYVNVYELGPQLDPAESILSFESAAEATGIIPRSARAAREPRCRCVCKVHDDDDLRTACRSASRDVG